MIMISCRDKNISSADIFFVFTVASCSQVTPQRVSGLVVSIAMNLLPRFLVFFGIALEISQRLYRSSRNEVILWSWFCLLCAISFFVILGISLVVERQ